MSVSDGRRRTGDGEGNGEGNGDEVFFVIPIIAARHRLKYQMGLDAITKLDFWATRDRLE